MIDHARVLRQLNARMHGDRGYARCPAHPDRRPSLYIRIFPNGRLWLKCMRGCPIQAVSAAIGVPLECYGVELRFQGAEGRRKPVQREIEAVYDYRDEKGELRYQKVRYRPKDFHFRQPDGKSGWKWGLDGIESYDRLLYNLPEILARPEQPVFVVEGENKVECLRHYGLVGTCNDSGAGPEKWLLHFGKWLTGRRVAILPDRDETGHRHANYVAGCLLAYCTSIRVVHLPGGDGDDVVDFMRDRLPGTTDAQAKAALLDYVRRAPEWILVKKEGMA